MPLTFPDGTRVRLIYDPDVQLAQFGVQPDIDFVWDERWIGAVVFTHGGHRPGLLSGDAPLEIHRRGKVPVEEWAATSRTGRLQRTVRWLVFRLDDWTVHVPLDGDIQAEEVMEAVRPRQTKDGFVVLQVGAPVEIPEGIGEAGGPKLSIGDRDPRPDFVRAGQDFQLIEIGPVPCHREDAERGLPLYARFCLADDSVTVHVTGDPDFVSRIVEGVSGQCFKPRPG